MPKRLTAADVPIGTRYSRLVIISEPVVGVVGTKQQPASYVDVRCDCGNIRHVPLNGLRSGNTRSCGCLLGDLNRERCRKTPGHSGKNGVLNNYLKSASNRSLPWGLTDEQFDALVTGNCHYCGVPPSRVYRIRGGHGDFIYNGIDRMDNTIGYVPGNVVSCCWTCNNMKKTMGYDEFLARMRRIAGLHPEDGQVVTQALVEAVA